ncbi:MAG: 3-demethylubiquinone-9 3-methyltransferase [Myxococcaceae bacterium]|nr:3-demethylubiquinone-9 3-methyltransferase [Myxococcaceae bacterium]
MQTVKISSFLWFQAKAEEAVKFYASVFGDHCKVSGTSFELFGQSFIAFNGGPHYQLNEAFSIMVQCDSQAELDGYWDALLAEGGAPSRCGWLKDRFGVSWQVVPRQLFGLLNHPDPQKASRVLQAMLAMQKLDLETLEKA